MQNDARYQRAFRDATTAARYLPRYHVLNLTNLLGGGKPTLTGPFLVDKSNIDFVGKFAAKGTR